MSVEFVNRGFSTLHNPRPVYITLTDVDGKVSEQPSGADPRMGNHSSPATTSIARSCIQWTLRITLPATIRPGWYQIGLWMPDASQALRLDPRYAVRFANRDVPWWSDWRAGTGSTFWE